MIYRHLVPVPEKKHLPEQCEKCPLGANARKVGARGTADSPFVMILEAPGTEELKFGAPVCGPSGDLLNKMVPEHFDFDDAYIINAMQCRPPKTNDQHKDKEYKSRAVAACRARVIEQVWRHPRKCVLALGAWSNTALTANFNYKITTLRGVPYKIMQPGGEGVVVVVPAVHPAFLLRGGGNPKVFREDIALAYNIAYEGMDVPHVPLIRDQKWINPKSVVVETVEDIAALWRKLQSLSLVCKEQGKKFVVTGDIETSGFNPFTDYILSVGFYWDTKLDTAAIIPYRALKDPAFEFQLSRMLRDTSITYDWHFGKFDEKFLRHQEYFDQDYMLVSEDTGLMSYALSEATKDHDLDEVAKNMLGAPEHKKEIKQWVPNKKASYANIPEPFLIDYHAKDLKKQHLLYEFLRARVAADMDTEKLYTRTLIPASHFLGNVETYGIAVDFDFVRINRDGATEDDLAKGLVDRLFDDEGNRVDIGLINEQAQILGQIADLAGWNCNPNAPEEVGTLLYDQFKLTIKGKRPQDTTKETLDKLDKIEFSDGRVGFHPAVKLVKQYRRNVRMLSTYVAHIERYHQGGIIHTVYKLHVTPTGRLSSTEPNLQNIPREARYRRMYRARKGYVLLEGDYNSAELRMLAALSGDRFLTGVFLDDKRNLHDEVSIAMYGKDFTQDQRIRAKAINFGIPYGRDAFSIGIEFDISIREAQRLIDAWFVRAPEARAFLDLSAKAAFEGKSLITIFGRKRRPGVVSPERLDGLQNEFKNFHMQSPISDFTLHSAMEMEHELRRWDAHTVNLIHDATLTEVPDHPEAIRECAKIIKRTMEDVPTRWITTPIRFAVDLKRGTHWGLGKKYEVEVEEEERPTIVSMAV